MKNRIKFYYFLNRGVIVGISYSPNYTSNGFLIYLGVFTIGITIYK